MQSKPNSLLEKPQAQPLTIIFLGRTGVGKSYTCNKISKKDLFKEGESLMSETFEFQMEYCYLDGNESNPIRIIDTPGFEDNNGLKLSQIYKMFINFIFKYQIEFNMIVYCLKLDTRIPENERQHLKRLAKFVGPKGLRNTHILLTQIDMMNPSIVDSMVQKYKENLHEIILKEIPAFDARNILVPDFKSPASGLLKEILKKLVSLYVDIQPQERFIDVFHSRLKQCRGIQISFDEQNFLNIKDESMISLLNLLKTEANADIPNTNDGEEQKKLKELVNLIDIIEGDQASKFSQIKKFGVSCSNDYLKALSQYFMSDDMKCKNTLINDIYQILTDFNSQDDKWRVKKSNYANVLGEELKSKMVPKMCASIKKIVDTTKPARNSKFKTFTGAGSLAKIKDQINDDTPEAVVKGAALGVSSGTIASSVAYVALFEGTSFLSWGVPAGYAIAEAGAAATSVGTISMLGVAAASGIGLAVAAVGTIVILGGWKRETLIKEVTTLAYQKFMEDQETQEVSLLKGLIQEACALYLFSE